MNNNAGAHDKIESARKLTEDEYSTILDFLYAYRFNGESSDGNRMYELLRFLTKYFGCKCASLWLVAPDSLMTSPIAYNIDATILNDYENNYQFIDEYQVRKWDKYDTSIATVMRMNDDERQPSGYVEALKERNITQKYGILMRENGRVTGAIGLFKSTDEEESAEHELSGNCLEVVAPFIAQEFFKTRKMDSFSKAVSILHTVLNTTDVGMALFDLRNPRNLVYYNPICAKYCYEFEGADRPGDNIVGTFIVNLIDRLGSMWVPLKDASFEMSADRNGVKTRFRVQLVENTDDNGMHSTCTLFMIPIRSSAEERPDPDTGFFSQLTSREQEIAMMIAKGYTNSEIAEKLYISLATVKSHIQHIFKKADVSNRTSLMTLLK